mmetsp:Transcript_19704/g.55531  ORF Transcript_19704/g.55531 Transcript_19704/m.55531 type:complete len:393 (+) Transcript_19704:406-1584(+)
MHPPQPLRGQAVSCDERFDTAVVEEALRLRRERTYGVVVIDGEEAILGTAQPPAHSPSQESRGQVVSQLSHLRANIASRTRRGGQSAARYSRNRDGEELAFLRKVAEKTAEALGDVRGLLVGGRGDMKRKLLAELSQLSRSRVARVVDVQCHADASGLQRVAAHLKEAAEADLHQDTSAAVRRFLEFVAQTERHVMPLICYGEAETASALRLGAVDQLLLWSTLGGISSRRREEWGRLAAASGASVVDVEPASEAALRFCQGFGVGACLRYPVDSTLLEEPGSEDEGAPADPRKPLPAPAADSESESVSTATSRTENLLVGWLQAALKVALQDATAAESLAACAEIVLFDESTPAEERLESTLEMLRGEGVPEEVLLELACHVTDHFGLESA